MVGGSVGLLCATGGRPRVAFAITITNGRITGVDLIADPERLRGLSPKILVD